MDERAYRNEFFVVMSVVLIVINILPFVFAEWVYREAYRHGFFLSLMNRFPVTGFSVFLFLILYRVKQRKEFLWLTISAILSHIPNVIFISIGGPFFPIIAREIWNMSTLDIANINNLMNYCNHLLGVIAGLILLVAILEFVQLKSATRKRPLIVVFLMFLSSSLPWWNITAGDFALYFSPWLFWVVGEGPVDISLLIDFSLLFLAPLFLDIAIFLMFLASTVKDQYSEKTISFDMWRCVYNSRIPIFCLQFTNSATH